MLLQAQINSLGGGVGPFLNHNHLHSGLKVSVYIFRLNLLNLKSLGTCEEQKFAPLLSRTCVFVLQFEMQKNTFNLWNI